MGLTTFDQEVFPENYPDFLKKPTVLSAFSEIVITLNKERFYPYKTMFEIAESKHMTPEPGRMTAWLYLVKSACSFLIHVFLTHADMQSEKADSTNFSAEWVGGVYYPKLPSDIATFDAVKKDLTYLLASAKLGIKYYRQQGVNNDAEKEALKALLKGKNGPISFYYNSDKELLHMVLGSIDVLDDRIEVSPRIAFFYTDLIDQDIAARKADELPAFARVMVGKYRQFVCPHRIHFPGLMSYMFENPADAQRFADGLFFYQAGATGAKGKV